MNEHISSDILAEEARFRPEAVTVRLLLGLSGMSQARLATVSGVTQSLISSYQLGRVTPSREVLARMALAAGWPLDFVESMVRSAIRVRTQRGKPGTPSISSRAAEVGRKVAENFEGALLEVERILRAEGSAARPASTERPSAHDAAAEDLWSRLADLDSRQRRLLIDASPAFHHMSLSLRLAEEGARLAAAEPEESAELARLARHVAKLCRSERPS